MFLPKRYEQLVAEAAAAERQRAQLHSPEVRILLVSKYQSREAIYNALEYFAAKDKALPPNLGENYVQAATQRAWELEQYYQAAKAARRPKLEMIGPLQSNKAAKAASLFSVLHSISSVKLLQALEKAVQNQMLNIFLQYNASGEEQKNGCGSYDELRGLVDQLLAHSRSLYLRGLMCMGPAEARETDKRRAFAACFQLAERLWRDFPPAQTEGRLAPYFELSMGMSSDYREALAEGANILRIGSLLFSD